MPSCDKPASPQGGTCDTEKQPCAPQQCCPVEMAVDKWSGAFCQAMTEVKVEILKEKIKSKWGSQLEQVSNAVVDAMGTQWEATLAQAKSHVELRENIQKVLFSGKK